MPTSRTSAFAHRVFRELSSLAILIVGVLAARSSLADHYLVPSGSMQPTVQIGDHVFVNKLAYGIHVPLTDKYALEYGSPAHGDVVVLRSPVDDRVLLKRVVAVPGDLVSVTEGTVTLNGLPVPVERGDGGLFEDLGGALHPVDLGMGGGPDFGPVKVPRGQFLVLGDNRGNSSDGRVFGFVQRKQIMGRSSGIWLRDGAFTWLGL